MHFIYGTCSVKNGDLYLTGLDLYTDPAETMIVLLLHIFMFMKLIMIECVQVCTFYYPAIM